VTELTAPTFEAAEAFLRERGTEKIAHPGGTLYDHLRRVAGVLADWGADTDVQLAGLCHATYGTDGFGTALLDTGARGTLAALIGPRAESLVYLYGGCDRDAVYPRLSATGLVGFRDRFSGEIHAPSERDLRAFLEITVANELDVLAHNAELAARHGPALAELFGRVRPRLSDRAWQACADQLGATGAGGPGTGW
jgi:hypothetical protein